MRNVWWAAASVAMAVSGGGVAARDATLNGAEVEKILVDGSVWGAGVDTRRPGCSQAQCGLAAATFVFEGKPGHLTARVYFHTGKDAFDAHAASRRFPGDITSGSEGAAVPVTVKSNGQVVFQSRSKWGCRFQGVSGSCVRQSLGDGYRDKFTLVRLPEG